VHLRARRLTAAVAVAAVATGGGIVATQAASGAPNRPAATTKTLKADSTGKLKFNVSRLTVKHGKVTIKMSNPSSLPHGIAVEGHGVDKDGKTVREGGTSTVTVTLKKGKYTFYCPVPGHRAGGMKGTITVT
jgi:uncharacterized cupredoxin-like copper-binding protein